MVKAASHQARPTGTGLRVLQGRELPICGHMHTAAVPGAARCAMPPPPPWPAARGRA